MTHKDIYTKFMIEYDKAGASTSYPSLTEYEVATVLDKAYNALIAQKVTGNNYRRVAVEGDLKSIADLGPLTKSVWVSLSPNTGGANLIAPNVTACEMPKDLLYILTGSMKYKGPLTGKDKYPTEVSSDTTYNPVDGSDERGMPVRLMNHEIASKFFSTSSNIPWVKEPVCFIEDRNIYVVYDPLNPPVWEDTAATPTASETEGTLSAAITDLAQIVTQLEDGDFLKITADELHDDETTLYKIVDGELEYVGKESDFGTPTKSFRITYIRRPHTFVKDLPDLPDDAIPAKSFITYFDYKLIKQVENSEEVENNNTENSEETEFNYKTEIFGDGSGETYEQRYTFECNSTVAEELISLAVAFALENVESQRLNSKLNMRGLEA